MRELILTLLLTVSLAGCVIHPQTDPERPSGAIVNLMHVKDGQRGYCKGFAISKDLMLTIGHCTEGELMVKVDTAKNESIWVAAKAVKTFQGRHDTIVLLKTSTTLFPGWTDEEQFKLNPGGNPHFTITKHLGYQLWRNAKSYEGDSGSPVFDKDGKVVGVVWGHYKWSNGAIYEPIPAGILK